MRVIRGERPPLKRGCLRTETGTLVRDGKLSSSAIPASIVPVDMQSEHPITP
jgi:hypothetical protein